MKTIRFILWAFACIWIFFVPFIATLLGIPDVMWMFWWGLGMIVLAMILGVF